MMRLTQSIFLLVVLGFSQIIYAAATIAPEINLPTINGHVSLKELKGKVVYLDFWASWCKPCKASFPWMHEMQAAYKDQGLVIVAVNLDSDKKMADDFLKEVDVNFIVAFDESGDSAYTYELRGMPSSYLIDRDGKLHASHIGFREKDKPKMEQAIKQLLKQQ